MGMLDHLIDKTNTEPKTGMEYIYWHYQAWYASSSPKYGTNHYNAFPIKEGSIMVDVVKLDNSSYDFTWKETGDRLHTNYGWALAENTPENRERIEKFNEYLKHYKEVERMKNQLLNDVITLKPINYDEEAEMDG